MSGHRVRFDWGPTGARVMVADARPGDVAVVVDVLSFTTTLTVAVERGVEVLPFPWAAEEAPAYAESRGAVLAVGRREALTHAPAGAVSLSPASWATADRIDRVVLPSPNGSAICFALADAGVVVVGAFLRNAGAVARRLAAADRRVSVVAAGERWPDGSLRPAVEDLWGAGAVLAGLPSAGASPEARAAVAAYDAVRGRTCAALPACRSGQELVEGGFARDVEIAAEADVSEVVPVLRGEAFVDGGAQL